MTDIARRWQHAAIAVVLIATGCSDGDGGEPVIAAIETSATTTSATTTAAATTTSPTSTTSTSTTAPTTSSSTTTTTSTTSTTTTTTSTTSTTTTSTTTSTTTTLPTAPSIVPIDPATIPPDTVVEVGRSVRGAPITVVRRGDPTGIRVLVIGAIHGNEDAGVAVVDRLLTQPLPAGIELWLVRSMNPDGQAARDRHNANQVDLNRNFPVDWDYLAEPGNWQYGGSGPASEPETQALVALGDGVRPHLVFWYHQDLYRLAPATGRRGEMRARYAEITGLPIVSITGGTYTGTAANWVRTVIQDGGETITVELGETLPEAEIDLHIAGIFALASEFW